MTVAAREREKRYAQLEREIVTPEGIAIRFTLAPVGDRAGAFVLDVIIQIVVVIAIVLGLQFAVGGTSSWMTSIVIVLAFLLVNFYFAFFEVRWQGATPGKRKIGIRVIDARGGQLETSAVLARNFVRELEVWMPLRFLLAGKYVWPTAPGWALVVAGAWTFVFMLMPLFNKDKLRIGDLIGGTLVVMQPKTVLAPDLVDQAAASLQMKAQAAPTYAFTDDQLAIYGIYELQVLEGVLRQDASTPASREALAKVSETIRSKLRFGNQLVDDQRFLKDFYVALRAHLEQKMLFGHRRADKYAARPKR
jgi:uncharacterized RDD family membrane protein YckC